MSPVPAKDCSPFECWHLPPINPDSKDTWPVVSTFPDDTLDDRAKIYSLILAPYQDGCALLGLEVAFGDWVIHQVDFDDASGTSMIPGARLLLIQPDGLPVQFLSRTVIQSMDRVVRKAKTLPPYDPPLVVKISIKKGKDGDQRIVLTPVMRRS
jgi:hypothetical protein